MSTKTVSSRQWRRKGARGKCATRGVISNDLHALEKWVGRLRKAHGRDVILRACYEAGPCGFGIARRLTKGATSAEQNNTHTYSKGSGSEATGHGSQSTMSR